VKEFFENLLMFLVAAAISVFLYNIYKNVINALDFIGVDFIDIAHDNY